MDYSALGQRIRQQRKLMNMTQEDLAAAANVSTSYIGHIERGIKHCSLDTLIYLCDALKITPNTLLQDSLENPPVDLDADLSPKARNIVTSLLNALRENEM